MQMKNFKIIPTMMAFATFLLFCVGNAHANTITGNLWHVPEVTSQNAIPANVPGTTPDVTFDVNSDHTEFMVLAIQLRNSE